ncbi:MAG: hypothetical protein V4662_08520 [Verrucomicrobiota bacterium]
MNDYVAGLEQQAQQYAATLTPSLTDTRELLILSAAKSCVTAHRYFETRLSDSALLEHLLATVRDADGYFSGDARIQASFYLGQFAPSLLASHSSELLALYDAEDGEGAGGCMRGLLARALAAARVPGGRERILSDSDPERPDNWLFVEAIDTYDQVA